MRVDDADLPCLESKGRAGSEKALAIENKKNKSASNLQTPGATPRSHAALMSQSLRIEPATSANLSQLLGEPRDKLDAGRLRDTGRLGMIGRGSLWLVKVGIKGQPTRIHSRVTIDANRITTGTAHKPRPWTVMPEDKPVAGEFTLFMAITPETWKQGTNSRMWLFPSVESKRHTEKKDCGIDRHD